MLAEPGVAQAARRATLRSALWSAARACRTTCEGPAPAAFFLFPLCSSQVWPPVPPPRSSCPALAAQAAAAASLAFTPRRSRSRENCAALCYSSVLCVAGWTSLRGCGRSEGDWRRARGLRASHLGRVASAAAGCAARPRRAPAACMGVVGWQKRWWGWGCNGTWERERRELSGDALTAYHFWGGGRPSRREGGEGGTGRGIQLTPARRGPRRRARWLPGPLRVPACPPARRRAGGRAAWAP
jgi:hypothetical protein